MNEIKNALSVENMIYEIRGKQVMLDSDLAKLYQCTNGTKTINQAVGRHRDRFPDDFYFQLTTEEYSNLWSQVGTANNMIRTLPYVFTEQGVAMLATVLRTTVASNVSIKIMRAFVVMRKYISTNLLEQKYINNLVMKHEDDINKLFSKLETKELKNEIFFEGQIYEAYSKILDILMIARNNIIIIDSYADKYVLDMVSKVKVNVTLIISSKSRLSNLDIDKYKAEFDNLQIIYNDSFHDRFIILDENALYHLGTSLNNAGTKVFAINKIDDLKIKELLLKEVKEK